jgi:hypothetical protein
MPSLTIELPKLHEAQRQIWNDPSRFIVLAAGRRFGKSRLGALLGVTDALESRRAWWVWPNYPNSTVGWRILKNLGMQIPGATKSEVDRMVSFGTGGWVQIKSADKPDSLRSEGLDRVIIDEAAHIRKFREMWEQALRPALSDRQGGAMFISSPAGYDDFWELFKQGQNGNPDWSSHQYPTWTNPFIDADEIEAARRDLPDLVFRQEYGAEFVQLAGALFKREYFQYVGEEPKALRWVRYWDLAASTKTSASLLAAGVAHHRRDGKDGRAAGDAGYRGRGDTKGNVSIATGRAVAGWLAVRACQRVGGQAHPRYAVACACRAGQGGAIARRMERRISRRGVRIPRDGARRSGRRSERRYRYAAHWQRGRDGGPETPGHLAPVLALDRTDDATMEETELNDYTAQVYARIGSGLGRAI